MALYVDDLLLFCKDLTGIQQVKSQLQAIYQMKDLGEADVCLGIQIRRDITTGRLSIDQSAYMQSVLQQFDFEQARPVTSPVESNDAFLATKDDEPLADQTTYQKAIGCLMYAMLGTRPDIIYTISKLSQHNKRPALKH